MGKDSCFIASPRPAGDLPLGVSISPTQVQTLLPHGRNRQFCHVQPGLKQPGQPA